MIPRVGGLKNITSHPPSQNVGGAQPPLTLPVPASLLSTLIAMAYLFPLACLYGQFRSVFVSSVFICLCLAQLCWLLCVDVFRYAGFRSVFRPPLHRVCVFFRTVRHYRLTTIRPEITSRRSALQRGHQLLCLFTAPWLVCYALDWCAWRVQNARKLYLLYD